jgi:hypothetical protein
MGYRTPHIDRLAKHAPRLDAKKEDVTRSIRIDAM